MSGNFLWVSERGSGYKAIRLPKNLPAPEGSQRGAKASAPLGPRPSLKNIPPPLPDNAGKGEPERTAPGPKGPSAGSLKEYPLKKEPGKGLIVWKRTFCGGQVKMGHVIHPEDAAKGKGSRSLGSMLKGFGARAPQPAGLHEKQLARTSSTSVGHEPGCPLRASHAQAKGDQPIVPSGVPQRASKVGAAGAKRTGKTSRQSFFEGTTLAVAHGNMEIRRKTNHPFAISELPNLADLELGDLIEIFRFGYQHWAIYVGNGYVIHLAPPTEYAGAGCASLMSTLTDKALVKKELLRDVAGKNRYRVNNKHDAKYPPLPKAKIVQRAEERVGQELAYKVTSENCEHFVNELRYGVPKSDQVRDAVVAAGIAGLGLATLGIIGVAVVKKRKNQQNQ